MGTGQGLKLSFDNFDPKYAAKLCLNKNEIRQTITNKQKNYVQNNERTSNINMHMNTRKKS